MIEPLRDVLRRLSNDENDSPDLAEKTSHRKKSENLLLAALSVARKIVRSKLVPFEGTDDAAADLEQGIALRLWKWRETHGEESERMSPAEWNAFAARTAHNEVNRHFSGKTNARSVPLEAAESAVEFLETLEGKSKAEIESLARFVWQDICQMSLRQRRALLLRSHRLVIYLLQGGISDEELARVLEFTEEVWIEFELPMSDIQIARLAEAADKTRSLESITKSIKKARHEARARLRKLTRK